MSGEISKGDRLRILRDGPWAVDGQIVTVDYVLPSYGKIITKREPGHELGMCLYHSQEGQTWERARDTHPKDGDAKQGSARE